MTTLTAKAARNWVPMLLALLFGLAVGALLLGPRNGEPRQEPTNLERHEQAWNANRVVQLEEESRSLRLTMSEVQEENDELRAQAEALLRTPEGLYRQAAFAFTRFEEEADTAQLQAASDRLDELMADFADFEGSKQATALSAKVEAHQAIAKALEAWDYGKAKKLAKASTKVIGKDAATRWLTATRLMARQPMDASLETMCGLAKGNRVAFRKQYDRRWVQLSAEIRKVATSVDEDSYVILPNTPGSPGCAQMTFEKSDLADVVSELRPGGEISAECQIVDATGYGYSFEYMMSKCRLLSGERPPEKKRRTAQGRGEPSRPLDDDDDEPVADEPTGGRKTWGHLNK